MSLLLSSKSQFEHLMYDECVISKASQVGSEYITALYRSGVLIAERVIFGNTIEHFVMPMIVNKLLPVKTNKLPA